MFSLIDLSWDDRLPWNDFLHASVFFWNVNKWPGVRNLSMGSTRKLGCNLNGTIKEFLGVYWIGAKKEMSHSLLCCEITVGTWIQSCWCQFMILTSRLVKKNEPNKTRNSILSIYILVPASSSVYKTEMFFPILQCYFGNEIKLDLYHF